MGLFTKTNLPKPEPYTSVSKKCEHKYQDFPWILTLNKTVSYYQKDNKLSIKLTEPYVCIYCGERKDIVLEDKEYTGYSVAEMEKIINQVKETYSGRIKPSAIVEDMINDLKFVDVEHLRWYHYLSGTKDPSTSRTNEIKNEIKLTK